MKRKVIAATLLSSLLASSLGNIVLAAEDHVRDVIADSLKVRTGPGTSYTTIATISSGTDVIDYDGSYQKNNGYYWMHVYYPKATYGKYTSKAIGYVADRSETYDIYLDMASNYARVATDTYTYEDSSLTDTHRFYEEGYNLHGTYNNDELIKASSSNPNAWEVKDGAKDNIYDVYYVNGWHVDAYRQD